MEDKEREFTHTMQSINWAVCLSQEPLLAQLQKAFGAGGTIIQPCGLSLGSFRAVQGQSQVC